MAGTSLTLGIGALTVLTLLAPTSWKATLEAKDGSKIGGTAQLEAVGTDSSRASINLTGAKPGSQLPWHVHQGACGTKGQIIGDPMSYPVLKVGEDGSATADLTTSTPLPSTGDYSVTVHKAQGDLTPIACGALKPDGEMTTMPPAAKDTSTRP